MSPQFQERLARVAADVEEALEEALQLAADPPPPRRLVSAMRHAVLGGGKRLRPFLAIETSRMLGGDPVAAERAGVAIELLHAYSLVHDDLPAMDDDDLRRGKPTIHRAFDEATAILAGDALQTLAFETLADPATHQDPAIRASLVLTLAKAAGMTGMAGGQMLDLEAEGRYGAGAGDATAVRRLQAMKTGALLAASVELGAVTAGADPAMRASLHAYGRSLGAAFQIADDLLDVSASARDVGKATGKDAARGKATLVAMLGPDAARAECELLVREAIDALALYGPDAEILREAARFAGERRA
jgi:farnesyl diphosphate synthase